LRVRHPPTTPRCRRIIHLRTQAPRGERRTLLLAAKLGQFNPATFDPALAGAIDTGEGLAGRASVGWPIAAFIFFEPDTLTKPTRAPDDGSASPNWREGHQWPVPARKAVGRSTTHFKPFTTSNRR